jgi:thioesterase domain-containing protein/acyl carrier protein
VSVAELKRRLRERLPEYMVPESIVVLAEMPLTPSGKIDRKRLQGRSEARKLTEADFTSPRDAFELQLVRIWESVLGIHPIGVTDDFFELGGHSLLAVNLMAKIRNLMGRELPLSSLFRGATIERLASLLRRDSASRPLSCLVELQASGSKPPLFFVHPAGGNVLCYMDLASCLGSDQPFYGLQTAGFYGEQAPFTRIEDMASHYLEALRTIQPQGPYFLGGWSLGGFIAYEMAQQLVAQGQEVGQLLLLDTGTQTVRKENIEEVEAYLAKDDAVLLMDVFGERLPISREALARDLESLQKDERTAYMLKKMIKANLLPPDVDLAQAHSSMEMYRANMRAGLKYVPQVYLGTVTLLRTMKPAENSLSDESGGKNQIPEVIRDPTMGWGKLAARGVRVVDAPGEHATMVMKPHAERLALLIKGCLNGGAAGRS